MLRKLSAIAASAMAVLGLTLATAGVASANPTVLKATTSLTNYPAAGNNELGSGVWATDTLSRAATLTDNGTDPSDPSLTDYTVQLADTGTFVTSGLAGNPNGGDAADPTDVTDGTVTGAASVLFEVDSSVIASTSGVPATVDGPPSVAFYDWASLFFPQGTKLNYLRSTFSYTYTYSDSKTCETWVASLANFNGGAPGAGGISGDGTCTLSVTNPGTLTATVGKPFSKQIAASTGSSAGGITYAFTGLPKDGLSGSASGLISGTPATAASITVTATVKDAVRDNCPANTEPAPAPLTYKPAVPGQPGGGLPTVSQPPPLSLDDDNGSCSTTFKIDVVTTPPAGNTPPPAAGTTPPAGTKPPVANGTTTPVGGVQTGGGRPAATTVPLLTVGVVGLMLLLGSAACVVRRPRKRG